MLKRGDKDHSPNKRQDFAFVGVLELIKGEWVSYRHERGITQVERRYVCSSAVGHIGEKCAFCRYQLPEVPIRIPLSLRPTMLCARA